VDSPPCDNGGKNEYKDSEFFQRLIEPFAPYTLGSVLWDQGERDVHCLPGGPENTTARYACMEQQLVSSWRKVFGSPFVFIAVQLPGYLGDCGTFEQCKQELFRMRLAQQQGALGDTALVSATYDWSCPFGVKNAECPFGTVHNVHKRPIGHRLAGQFLTVLSGTPNAKREAQGPLVHAVSASPGEARTTVSVTFSGGAGPSGTLHQKGTANCAACCTDGSVGDFDVSTDFGATWLNGTLPTFANGSTVLTFAVATVESLTDVRYTANQPFPQCAVYNAQDQPALPFHVKDITMQAP